MPYGNRDKNIATAFFIDEKKGPELKSNILDLRRKYLGLIQGNTYFEDRIVLKVEELPGPETKAKTWEEYKFKGMPLAAVMPVLAKYKADAIASEIAVLQYLNE